VRRCLSLIALCLALTACREDIVGDDDKISELHISAGNSLVFVGDTLMLSATGLSVDGAQISVVNATWSSSDSTIVRVDGLGRAIALKRGSATVTARVGAASDTATIVVDSIVRLLVSSSAPASTARSDEQVTLSASLITLDDTIAASSKVVWSSLDTTIAVVSPAGVVTFRKGGYAVFEATYKTFKGGISLLVTSPPPLPAVIRQAACSAPGKIHYGTEPAATWRLADSPHYLVGEVVIANVIIEPGVVVCAYPGAQLVTKASTITASGTADRPIRFTAVDTLQKWVGIDMYKSNGSASLSHSVLEFTSSGISGWGGELTLRDSRVRGAGVGFCGNFTSVNIRRSIIEDGNVCVSDGTFEDNVIRRGRLMLARDRSIPGTLALNGGRIENGPDRAFWVATQGYVATTVTSSRPMRIVGAAGYPIDSSLEIFTQIWPTRAAQDSLLGNARDTLMLWGNEEKVSRPLFARSDLPWMLYPHQNYAPSGIMVGDLSLEPGASLNYARLVVKGSINIVGTSAQPIRLAAEDCDWCGLYLANAGTSQLKNVIVSGSGITVMDQHSVSIQFCDIIGTRGDGLRVASTGVVQINDCNIRNNAGRGVNNTAASTVNARRNWWGDPAGPLGPAGDGISGNVDASEPRPGPVDWQ
jgi:hypothetical protein